MTIFDPPSFIDEEFHEICSTLFRVSADALIAVDEDQVVVRINQGAEKIFGYEASEVIGKRLDVLLPKDAISAHSSHIKKFGATPVAARYMGHRQEISGRRKSGEVFPAEATIAKIVVGQKQIFFASLRDITDRKKMEERLKASEAFSRSILDSLYSQVVVLDAQGVITAVNRAWGEFAQSNHANQETVTGIGLNYMEARQNAMSLDDEFERAAMDGIQKVRDGRETLFTMEYPCHSSDERRWFFMRVVSLTDGSGGVVVSHQEITARKLAEEAREASEKKFRALIENSTDGVLTLNQNGIVEYCSPAITRMLGYSVEEFTGRNAFELIHPDDLNNSIEKFANLTGTHEGFEGNQLRVRHKNGSWRWLEAVGINLIHDPAIGGIVANFQDITERVEMFSALQKSEELYRLTVQNATEVFYKVALQGNSLEGQVVFVSPQAEAFTGHKEEEFLQNPALWLNLVHADDLSNLYQTTQEVLTRREAGTRVYRIKNSKTDEYLWVEDHIIPLMDADGSLLGYQGVARDITNRKQAEEKLRESEERYRTLIEQAADGIFVAGPSGYHVDVNTSGCMMLGYSREEIFAKRFVELIAPEDLATAPLRMKELQDGKSIISERRLKRKDGRLIPVEVNVKILSDGRIQSIVRDITERKQAEQERTRLLNILEASLNEIYMFDAKTLRFQYANTGALRDLGYLPAAIETMTPLDIKPEFDQASFRELIAPLLRREKEQLIFQTVHRRADASLYPVEVHLQLVEQQEAQVFLAIILNITERKQAELALREANEHLEQRVKDRTAEVQAANLALEKASKLKNEFLAGMSHELRTPLNGVISLSESLQEGTYGELSPRQKEILDVIGESGRHLLELINDILDLSKIEAGKLTLQYDTFTLKSLCNASLRMVSETAQQKGLHVSSSITDEIETIHADGRRLKQMLVNLLGNAVKFTPPGGSIGLEVLPEQEHAIRFTVWDTGIGIPAEHLEKLFNPFTQVDSSLNRKYEGTGLGLALVRQLADIHNGSVGVESTEGKGSRFYFIIPIHTALDDMEKESAKILAAPLQSVAGLQPSATILLVEDNPTNMLVTYDYLTSTGFKVVTAVNGIEAMEQAATHRPGLILMDIQMPGVDGLEATRRLRSAPEFATVPIIALTALAMPGDRERCLAAGATEYLAKPVSLKKLVEVIANLLK